MVLDSFGRIMLGRSADGRAMRLRLRQDRQGPTCDDWGGKSSLGGEKKIGKNAGKAN
jgi:hypothetical protein